MGLLPLRRHRQLTAALLAARCRQKVLGRPRPKYDVAFLGRPNRTQLVVDGRIQKVDQRIDWLREIRAGAPELTLWGGLTGAEHSEADEIEQKYGDVSNLDYAGGETSFVRYFRALRRSRVLLAPGGNVPWSYRHYECLYAGGVVASIDYRQRDMLVPLPRENMVHVADGAAVIPALHEALELSRKRPSQGEENYRFLEQYLRFGQYSAARPALLQRFTAQLE